MLASILLPANQRSASSSELPLSRPPRSTPHTQAATSLRLARSVALRRSAESWHGPGSVSADETSAGAASNSQTVCSAWSRPLLQRDASVVKGRPAPATDLGSLVFAVGHVRNMARTLLLMPVPSGRTRPPCWLLLGAVRLCPVCAADRRCLRSPLRSTFPHGLWLERVLRHAAKGHAIMRACQPRITACSAT